MISFWGAGSKGWNPEGCFCPILFDSVLLNLHYCPRCGPMLCLGNKDAIKISGLENIGPLPHFRGNFVALEGATEAGYAVGWGEAMPLLAIGC